MKVLTVEHHVTLTPDLDPVPFWLIIERDGYAFCIYRFRENAVPDRFKEYAVK